MRNRLFVGSLMALMGISAGAYAETLLVDRARQKPAAALPLRGDSMSQVEGRYGAPQESWTRAAARSVNGRPSIAGCIPPSRCTSKRAR